jgi:hypothetical protein
VGETVGRIQNTEYRIQKSGVRSQESGRTPNPEPRIADCGLGITNPNGEPELRAFRSLSNVDESAGGRPLRRRREMVSVCGTAKAARARSPSARYYEADDEERGKKLA